MPLTGFALRMLQQAPSRSMYAPTETEVKLLEIESEEAFRQGTKPGQKPLHIHKSPKYSHLMQHREEYQSSSRGGGQGEQGPDDRFTSKYQELGQEEVRGHLNERREQSHHHTQHASSQHYTNYQNENYELETHETVKEITDYYKDEKLKTLEGGVYSSRK